MLSRCQNSWAQRLNSWIHWILISTRHNQKQQHKYREIENQYERRQNEKKKHSNNNFVSCVDHLLKPWNYVRTMNNFIKKSFSLSLRSLSSLTLTMATPISKQKSKQSHKLKDISFSWSIQCSWQHCFSYRLRALMTNDSS